ncbi:hypothetical protein [Lentilactobacillus farraginis]|uniref:Uncharacterized protein n=2 Tax=Lentilactobacillus farraginis DSM 18382 = JCM 14108 TaxID=1423743 RepID=X0PKG6_9LACO|nr:hypothetical protein [Lentilactobacillus farraginis]GAF37146.1 hypothetical protein JCM14108_2161 [Lentilactobacillus farraginis DSM 18382 = JCM 14108]
MNIYLNICLMFGIPAAFAITLNLIGYKLIQNKAAKKKYFKFIRILGPIVVIGYALILWPLIQPV